MQVVIVIELWRLKVAIRLKLLDPRFVVRSFGVALLEIIDQPARCLEKLDQKWDRGPVVCSDALIYKEP
jgi:hypothetical protein